jgi:hypothetical protein
MQLTPIVRHSLLGRNPSCLRNRIGNADGTRADGLDLAQVKAS